MDDFRIHNAQNTSIRDQTWTAAVDAARDDPVRAFVLAQRAYFSDRKEFAAGLWKQAATTIPAAGYNLGVLRAEQGDPAGAAAAYQLAIDSGHPDEAPAAARNLGALRAEQGDPAGAAAAWQLAIDSGHADQAPAAACNLGALRKEQGDPAGAAAAWQLAIDSGHADEAPKAREHLAHL